MSKSPAFSRTTENLFHNALRFHDGADLYLPLHSCCIWNPFPPAAERGGHPPAALEGGIARETISRATAVSELVTPRSFEGRARIYRIKVADRRIEQVADRKNVLDSDFADYRLIALMPGDQPLVSIVRRNADVYALDLDLP